MLRVLRAQRDGAARRPPRKSSRTPRAQVWQNAGTAYAWPEDDVEAVASKPSVGVAFSGGGTRSYAASVGVAQALEALGLLSKIKYMSGVSGGSWFVSALAYDQSDDEAALLCRHRGGNGVRHARRLSRPVSFRLIFGRAIVSRSVHVCPRTRARGTLAIVSRNGLEAYVFLRDVESPCSRPGPYAPPSNLTLEYLADLPAGCMADATTYNFIGEVVAKAAGDIFDKEELFSTVWEEVVDEAIFRPRGIASKSRAALSAKAAEDARARSPNLAAYPFVWPRRLDAVPFPISSGTLLGPVALSPYARHNRSFTIVQHTPIYSGNPYTSTVTYNSQDGCDDDDHCVTATDSVRVGGLFSAYAYGADVPLRNASLAPGQRSGELAVLAPKDGATVQRAAAMSSMAPAAWFANESPELLGVTLSEEYAYAPDAPAASARLFYTGDGGVLENNGLIPLLQRGLDRVVVFANTLTPLADRAAWDPAARAPTASDIDANIPALFGIVVEDAPSVIDVAVGTDYSSIQVFRCVEINQWNGRVQQNFKPLYLDQIEVDSADFWTNRLLSSSSRSTAKEFASKLSHTRTLKSG